MQYSSNAYYNYTINKDVPDNILAIKYNDKKMLSGIYVES